MDNIHNKPKCSDTIRKVHDKLEIFGYNMLYHSKYDNILCKTSDVTAESVEEILDNNSDDEKSAVYIIRKKCSMVQTGNCSATISNSICSHTGCKLPSKHCPMYNQNTGNIGGGNNSNTSGDNSSKDESSISNSELLEALYNYLIRIRPTDTYNGIFLHAIMLNNETCDLKMTFNYGDDAVQEIVDTVIFLTT